MDVRTTGPHTGWGGYPLRSGPPEDSVRYEIRLADFLTFSNSNFLDNPARAPGRRFLRVPERITHGFQAGLVSVLSDGDDQARMAAQSKTMEMSG